MIRYILDLLISSKVRKDISIGENSWIVWIEPDYEDVYDIDSFLDPTWAFWQKLEIHCVSGCCGISAFSFWPNDMENAVKKLNRHKLLFDITNLKGQIIACSFHSISSSKLNNLFEKTVFIDLLTHIENYLISETIY